MKQTNNAIKFLMAQYRAIFKNANIAMVAAMAAAALAAGQAQAANVKTWGDLANQNFTNTDNLQVSGSGTVAPPANAFNITISSGDAHFIKSDASAGTFAEASGKASSITINGEGAKLTIGDDANAGATVELSNFNVTKGTLAITGSGTTFSTLKAGAIVLGTAPASSGTPSTTAAPTAPTATIELNANGIVGDATKTTSFDIYGDGELKFKGAGAKAASKNGINLNGGKISVADNATGTVAGALTVTDGAVEVNGGTKENTLTFENLVTFNGGKLDVTSGSASGGKAIFSKGLTMNDGTLTVKGGDNANTSGKLDVSGTSSFNTGSNLVVEKNGDATFKSNVTFADGTVENAGSITAKNGAVITVNKVDGLYADSTTGGKLNLSGSTLSVLGTTALDLTKANIAGDASSKFVADKAAVTVDKAFNTKVNSVKASTIVAKTVVESISDLNITSGDGRKFLFISGGSLTALNELKGSQANSEVAIFNNTGTPTLNLGSDETTKGKLTDISRIYVGATLAGANANPTLNVSGKWDFANAKVSVGNGGKLNINHGADVSNIERLQIFGESGNTITTINGILTIQRLLGNEKFTNDDAGRIDVNGTFNITGNGKEDGPNSNNEYANDVQLSKVTLNINAGGTVALTTKDAWDDVLKVNTNSDTGITTFEVVATGGNTTDFGSWKKENVKLNAGGTLSMDLSGYKVADKAALDKLAADLKAADSKGLIDFGGLSIGKVETNKDGSIELDKMPTAKTEATQNLEVNLGQKTTLDQSYSMGSANVSGNSLTIGTGSTVEFNNAKNGQFATNKDAAANADSKVSVTLAKDSALNLNGNGSLGDIKQSGTGTAVVLGGNNGTQKVGVVYVATFNQVGGTVTTDGAITATDMSVNGVLNAGGNITTSNLDIDGGAIKAAGKDITVSGTTSADIYGDVEARSLLLSGGATIAGDVDVKLGTLKLQDGKTLNVGRDGEDGSTASVFTDKLEMGAGSTIFVDPSYKDHATVLATKVLTDGTADDDVSVSNGTIKVGKNAAFGIGFEQAEFNSVMSNYLVDGKFTDPVNNQGYANAFVLNTSLNVKSGTGVSVKHNLNDADTVADNSFTLGGRAALIITDKAFGPNKQGTAITFGDSNNGVATATVTADASSVISLVGDFDVNDTDLKIFAAVDTGGAGTVTINGGNSGIKVQALGGLISGTLATNGSIDTLTLDPVAEKAIRSEVSAPVGQLFVDIANGKFDGATGAGYDFVVDAISYKQFKAVDAAAHAATYAGAQQAAVVSVTTMADAMFGRVGSVGVEAASIAATGSQANGGVWLTPMYKLSLIHI